MSATMLSASRSSGRKSILKRTDEIVHAEPWMMTVFVLDRHRKSAFVPVDRFVSVIVLLAASVVKLPVAGIMSPILGGAAIVLLNPVPEMLLPDGSSSAELAVSVVKVADAGVVPPIVGGVAAFAVANVPNATPFDLVQVVAAPDEVQSPVTAAAVASVPTAQPLVFVHAIACPLAA